MLLHRGQGAAGPNAIAGLAPAAWFRYGQGITVAGAGVSQWSDQSGNGRHLLQAVDTNRPALQADNSILFDGVDNFLKCDAFTLNQPETAYIVLRQVTWTANDTVFDGNALNSMRLYQENASPSLTGFAGTNFGRHGGLAIATWGVVCAVYNGASSLVQINNGTPLTGSSGAANGGGLTLGANGTVVGNYGNIEVRELIVYPTAHDAGTRAIVNTYLRQLGAI